MPTYKGRTCIFTAKKINYIDYKNIALLRNYLTKYNKIVPRYYSGTSLKHQKHLAKAIKNARMMGLFAFTPR